MYKWASFTSKGEIIESLSLAVLLQLFRCFDYCIEIYFAVLNIILHALHTCKQANAFVLVPLHYRDKE